MKLLKWNYKDLIKATLGILIFALAVNFFISPLNLYNGGFLGISQLLRNFCINVLHFNTSFDLSGIIYLILNIPLFILAKRKISKSFVFRTLYIIIIQAIFLAVIPVPSIPLVSEYLTSILIGAVLTGVGGGLILSAGASTGGTDILGVVLTKANKRFSVGKIGLFINIILYLICGYFYGITIMIYSILYSLIATFVMDSTHEQNVNISVTIYTKKKPDVFLNYIIKELNRDATYLEATGGYSKTKTYIIYTILSRYEKGLLEDNLAKLDSKAFIVCDRGINIIGKFDKHI